MILSKYVHEVNYNGSVILANLRNGRKAICYDINELNVYHRLKAGEDIPAEQLSDAMKVFCTEPYINEAKAVIGDMTEHSWNSHNLSFIIMPTFKCMFNCVYCYENKSDDVADTSFYQDFLEAIKAYDKDIGIDNLSIEWYGGEPLICADEIIRFTQTLNEYTEENNIQTTYSMTTNAYLLTYEMAYKLITCGIKGFQITIDGMPASHDSLRPLKNGDGTWNTIVNNLTALHNSALDFNIMIRVNYNIEVLETLEDFYTYITENLDNRYSIFFHAIGKWGGENDNSMSVIEPCMTESVDLMLIDDAITHGILPEMNMRFMYSGGRVCYANKPYSFVLTYDKKLRKCTFTDSEYDQKNLVGYISSDGIILYNDIWKNFVTPDYQEMSKKGCFDCKLLPTCQGMSCGLRRVCNDVLDCIPEKHTLDEIIISELKYAALNQRIKHG